MFNSRRARLEIDLPTGISIVFDADGLSGKPLSRQELMARMRAAIGATDWEAVKALYGEAPYSLSGSAQLGGPAAMPTRRAATQPSKPAQGQSSGEPPAVRAVSSSP